MAKSFKDKMQQKAAVNPTLQFISQPDQEESAIPQTAEIRTKRKSATVPGSDRKAPPARRALPQFDEETKSRRLQLLLTPSLYEAIKSKAIAERLSVNELINSLLKDAIEK